MKPYLRDESLLYAALPLASIPGIATVRMIIFAPTKTDRCW